MSAINHKKLATLLGVMIVSMFSSFTTALAIEPSAITQVVLLGVGTPNPEPSRSGPATAIIVNGTPYIIDAGPGVMRRAKQAQLERGIDALDPVNINHLFLTHLHWDHTAGLPDVLLTGWTMGRNQPMILAGPPGTKGLGTNIIEAYAKDIDRRVNGLEPTNDQGWRIEAIESTGGIIFEDENVTVEAFPVCHGDWDYAFGYKFTTPDRIIVISGDTTYCPIIAEKAAGADILIHEVIDEARRDAMSPEWIAYHTAFHTIPSDIARIAQAAQPKLLILHHLLVPADGEQRVLDDIKAGYDGAVAYGHDLDVF